MVHLGVKSRQTDRLLKSGLMGEAVERACPGGQDPSRVLPRYSLTRQEDPRQQSNLNPLERRLYLIFFIFNIQNPELRKDIERINHSQPVAQVGKLLAQLAHRLTLNKETDHDR